MKELVPEVLDSSLIHSIELVLYAVAVRASVDRYINEECESHNCVAL